MKISVIAEGSYPYVAGGVSSWLQNLIRWFDGEEFKIISINPTEKKKGLYAYTLPENISEISEIFMDTAITLAKKNTKRKYFKSDAEKNIIINHLSGEKSSWGDIFEFARRNGGEGACAFFFSKDFLDVANIIYSKDYSNVPFLEFVWTLRSMYMYQFYILNVDIPEADVYHSISAGYAGLVGAMIACVYRKPFVITEHGIYNREREEDIIKNSNIKGYAKKMWIKYFYSMSLCAYRYARTVISLYEKNKEIQINCGCSPSKIVVIPNAIDGKHFKRKREVRRGSSDEIIVGAVVRVVPIKDIITMILSFKKAKEKDDRLKLYIIGPCDEDPDYYNYCKEYIRNNNIMGIEFTGQVDVREYLDIIDIFLLTSISEAQPLSILEAMSYNVPIISTDVGACSELIFGNNDNLGEAGIIVPIMDNEKISDAIVYLSNNEKVRQNMGNNGAKRVNLFYNKEKLVEKYKMIYSIAGGGTNGWDWISTKKAY